MKRGSFILSLLCLISVSCSEDIAEVSWDHTKFEEIDPQSLSSVNPSYGFDYWELVRPSEKAEGDVIYRHGVLCYHADQPYACSIDFFAIDADKLHKNTQGLPFFIRTNQRDYNKSWYGIDDLLKFTGPVDSKGDAILIAMANGYYFEPQDSYMSGVRAIHNGYELIGLKVVSNCQPVLINQYLITVSENGEIHAEAEKVFIDDSGKCLDDQKTE